MDVHEPTASKSPVEQNTISQSPTPTRPTNDTSGAKVALIGAGGCGINMARPFVNDVRLCKVAKFDTSSTNERAGEKVFILANGSGSGSNRAANAREIEQIIPTISDDALGKGDVAIVCFSLAGGSGSLAGPLLIRDLHQRGVRVVAVVIADTTSSVGANNTNATLKTLNAITNNRKIYLPVMVLTNDNEPSRGVVDANAKIMIDAAIATLTAPVYEVDRNDRLNWINPTQIVDTAYGLKIMSFDMDKSMVNPKIVLGTESKEMVDTLLILQPSPDDTGHNPLPMARLKKTGYYIEPAPRIVAKVSSDISCIETIIDYVEKMATAEKAAKHASVSRLSHDSGDDIVF